MQKSPVEDANFLSKFFLCWTSPLLRKGFRKKLDLTDVYKAPSYDHADTLSEKLEREWNREVESTKKKPSLMRALARCYLGRFLFYGVLLYVGEATKSVQSKLSIISSFDPFHVKERRQRYYLAMGLCLLYTGRFLLLQPALFGLHHLGMQIRIALFSLIYKKTLKLSTRVLDKISTGQLVSLMSAHLNKLDESLGLAHFIWITPLQCILCAGILWDLLEVNGFCALATLTLLGIIQTLLSHKMGPYRAKRAGMISRRLALTSEIMENIHSVKAYGWEEVMETIIKNIRQDEMTLTRKIGSLRYFYSASYFFSAIFVTMSAIVPRALSKGIILRRIYTSSSYCKVMRMTLTRQLPGSIQMWYDTLALIKKIEEFLLKEEYRMLEYNLTTNELELVNASASWNESISKLFEKTKQDNKESGHPNLGGGLFFTNLHVTPVLKNISFYLEKGNMLAVAGSTGSGKSSLMMMILGELMPSEGEVRHSGRISFSPQTSWIMPGTIRDNILFGLSYDEYHYTSVIKACQLDQDFAVLPERDETYLLEGGVNLSRGQRARIGLARAVYKDADLYLLDAPFSHLDIVTEKQIFEKCVCKQMGSKTRIVVTNKLEHLKRADKILFLQNGECSFFGTFAELQAKHPDFTSILLGLEACDNIRAERSGSIISETLHNLCVNEATTFGSSQPSHQSFCDLPPPPIMVSASQEPLVGGGYPEKDKQSLILSSQEAAQIFSITGNCQMTANLSQSTTIEDRVTELTERKYSVVPEDDQVVEVLPRGNLDHYGLEHLNGRRSHSVLSFITSNHEQEQTVQIQSFRKKLSLTPQSDLVPELGLGTNQLSKDTHGISEEVDQTDLEQCFADEREKIFETTSWSTYLRYVTTNRNLVYVLIFIIVVFVIEVAGSVIGIFLVTDKIWRDGANPSAPNYIDEQHPNASSPPVHLAVIVTPTSAYYIIYIYVVSSESVLALGFFRGLPLVHTLLTVSKRLHERMLSAVLRAPMTVLNTLRTGRIMNRFTKDMAAIDDMLPLVLFDLIQLTLIVIGSVFTVSIIRPYIFIAFVPLAVTFIVLRRYFLRTGQQLKMLESEARTPIFSHLIISMKGLWVIRAFGHQSYFETLFHKALNTHTAVWFHYLATLRWFLFRCDMLFVLFFIAAAFTAVGTNREEETGDIGVVVAMAMLIHGIFQWAVITSVTVDGLMRSVDRVFKFIDLPSEETLAGKGGEICDKGGPDLVIGNPHVGDCWPSHGRMDIQDLTVKYTEAGRAVFSDVSFSVDGRQSVGLLGRTGSGKSTLLSALLRLINTEGEISIDGVSWNSIPLNTWRKAFGVVPQKVFIFTGTFRMNLDPHERCTDEELWRVAEEVGLKSVIEQFPNKLDFQLEDGGKILSKGHKQLLCLARSLLSEARILLLDEPFADVDPITLQVLRKTLKQSFSGCTIILSEHRVEPLLECQSFLMIEGSSVQSYNSIQQLNENSNLEQAISPAYQLISALQHPCSNKRSAPQTTQISALLEEDEDNDTHL